MTLVLHALELQACLPLLKYDYLCQVRKKNRRGQTPKSKQWCSTLLLAMQTLITGKRRSTFREVWNVRSQLR